ncbi:MAG: NAD(P)-binding domain-containing protein, partial [Actinomycetota bacterium]
ELNGKPFPPGSYPVVVLGSGPGGLQLSYSLSRLGVEHALLSEDDAPGGMFRRFPLFQRLITWTKIHAPAERGTRPYEWYDWNSLIGDQGDQRALTPGLMDGTSYFPSRAEMEQSLVAFAERGSLRARYGCRWEGTKRLEPGGFVVETSDGEYRCEALVVAVGMTQPWKPQIPGLDGVPHYVETLPAREYAGKRVLVIGKRNSGFEVADGLLPWASQIVLASPRPARISVLVHSTAAARARYLQPYEDHVLGGGNVVLDAAIERVERTATGYRALLRGTSKPGDLVIDADEVVAATGFTTPLRDLPKIGVATFYQGRLPAQTPWWESPAVPGIFFAGSITQGSIGLKKYGIPSNSAAVHGFRYNARVMARRIAETMIGVRVDRPTVEARDVVGYLLAEATYAPELWNQQSYLARVLLFEPDRGIVDEGIVPLAHFVDDAGPNAVAIAVETDAEGDIHPAVYVRRDGRVDEHPLPSSPLLKFDGREHQRQLADVLKGFI